MTQKPDYDSTTFNMAAAYLQRLDNILRLRDQAVVEGNHKIWYRCLKILWSNITPKVEEKGNEDLENEIRAQLLNIENYFLKNNQNGYNIDIEHSLWQLDSKLNLLLYQYGLLMGTKRTLKTMQEKLEEDFQGEF